MLRPPVGAAAPPITVVVPSHDRPARLATLLDALAAQTLAGFSVVVVHDSAGAATDELLRTHPLTTAGRLEHARLPAGTGRPGRQRDVGWRRTAAPLVVFVDDDCRPEPGWLAALADAAAAHPGALVQGRVVPDPLEAEHLAAPYHRTLSVEPPNRFAQTANIAYPRAALEAVDGFARTADLRAGEDTDLALRARSRGFGLVGAPGAVVFHAVEPLGLRGALRGTAKWADLAWVVGEHPELRELLFARVFWRREHAALLLAALGLALPRRAALVAAAPYALARVRRPRDLARLPGRALLDAVEVATCIRGSLRHRTLFL